MEQKTKYQVIGETIALIENGREDLPQGFTGLAWKNPSSKLTPWRDIFMRDLRLSGQTDNPLVSGILGAWPQGERFPSYLCPSLWMESYFAYDRMSRRLVPSEWRERIGRTVKTKREFLGMEPHYLASLLGVPTESVRLIERGAYLMDWATARAIYKALGLDPKDFPNR